MPKRRSKAKIVYHDVEQGSPQWHKDRENKYTGSNASKLLSSFGAGRHAQSRQQAFSGNFHTERGHILEDGAIRIYERINDVKVGLAGYVTNSLYPECLYSPDGFLEDRVIEVKCFSPKKHLQAIYKQSTEILAQCHFGQLILDKKLTDLVLYCPKPKNWDEATDGEWPVPIEKMFVVIPIKRNVDIQNNFKRILGVKT